MKAVGTNVEERQYLERESVITEMSDRKRRDAMSGY